MTELTPRKKIVNKVLNQGKELVVEPVGAIALTDLIISKESEGRLTLSFTDGEDTVPLLFIDGTGVFPYSFPGGLIFWRGASLMAENLSNGTVLITAGYLNVQGLEKGVWFNG